MVATLLKKMLDDTADKLNFCLYHFRDQRCERSVKGLDDIYKKMLLFQRKG